ncbi:hypothetical protein [Rugosimonospora africana]|uniref:Uncharacterized protein n=1 Tax=Rugosimonospora africana TaxID=556532 RepID=A0A8J3R4I4_9ACTN|nr:hypothetical protein [Rugosimonospora africana]GIH21185.1 hypothetical protein Raf01_93570 [Rugosimonospora africana]
MTALGVPARVRTPRVTRVVPVAAGRLLRLELRRNAMIWTLPLLAALFWFDTYRRATGLPPLWTVRGMAMQWRAMFEFLPFVAGVAAWTGSRDGRRRITDLVGVTARPGWVRQLSGWAATTCWAEAAYLGCAAVLYGVTAAQATWGGPVWWPLAVGATCIAAATALGFAAGALLSSRFTPPLVVVVTLMLLVVVSPSANSDAVGRLSPLSTETLGTSAGIFHSFIPDLSIAQLMFYGGIAVAVLGALGLPAIAGGWRLRSAAAVVTVAGLAAAGTGVGLAGTSDVTANGVVIPALHDTASDRPTPYTPACDHGGSTIPVCLHPAFKTYLPALIAALDPLLGEVAGLPGAPVRVTQTASLQFDADATIDGSPPVLHLTVFVPTDTVPNSRYTTDDFVDPPQLAAAATITRTLIGVDSSGGGSPAQQAVAAALLKAANVPLPPPGVGLPTPGQMPPAGSPAYAAAQRFAALPAATRHAWLAAHLSTLRAGHVTLAQLP